MVKLNAGQRYLLKDENVFVQLIDGSCEIYAVTRKDTKISYRQTYLLDLLPQQAAFPSFDEFEQMDVLIYAVEDSELDIIKFDEAKIEKLLPLMQIWFRKLVELPWLRLLADRGDDVLIHWLRGTVLNSCTDKQSLLDNFLENEQIFSMLLGTKFQAEEKKLSNRLEIQQQYKRQLIDESIENLLGTNKLTYTEVSQTDTLEEANFIVHKLAIALSMSTKNIHLSPDIVRKLDQLQIIHRLMQKGNMQMRLVNFVDDWYKKDSGVFLGYYGEDKELAAIIPMKLGKYYIFTKSYPDGILLNEETNQLLDKDGFACYAGFPSRKLKVIDLMKFMFNQCWKVDYRTIILSSFIAGIIPLVTPIITETIFQDILPIQDRQGLATVTQVMMVTSFSMAAISIVRSVAVLRITTHIDMATEAALWNRLLSLPSTFFRKYSSGELAQRMQGIDSIKSVVSGEFVSTVFNFIFSFWSLFLMCYYSLKLTAAALCVWVIYCFISAFIYRRVINFQRNLVSANNKTASIVQQIFTGLSKFRVQGAEEQAFYLWSKVFGEEWKWNLKLRWQNNYNMIISAIQPFILTMLLYYITIYGMQTTNSDGTVTLGISYAEFIAFSAAYASFNGTLNAAIPLVGTFFSIQPHIENLRPILNEEPESTDDKVDAEILSGAIEVNHLTFAYNEDGPNILNDISFRVSAGETLAIVGKSGCGKSTLIRLLLGFEKPKLGAIYYDGQDLAELSLPSVRSQMGVVLQNGQLMTGDIFTNIVGTSSLTQKEAWAAAEAAGIADDIREMPMGMQTVISEGSSNISGGQRQRLLIARALAARPSIIIFDEATSALDNRTQAIVTESLNKLRATRIIVAHRLSTIRNADRILVLDNGTIAEEGNFEKLVAQNGIFAKLVKRQLV